MEGVVARLRSTRDLLREDASVHTQGHVSHSKATRGIFMKPSKSPYRNNLLDPIIISIGAYPPSNDERGDAWPHETRLLMKVY